MKMISCVCLSVLVRQIIAELDRMSPAVATRPAATRPAGAIR
jgi:hypothetical protein